MRNRRGRRPGAAPVHAVASPAIVILPPGLPRPHYHFRTTIIYAAPYRYRRPLPRLSVYEAPAVLYAPVVMSSR